MSKRVTPSKRSTKRKKSAPRARHELLGHYGTDRGGAAKALVKAIDCDPFEIIGFASIATAGMQSDVGELFDELAEARPRLGPTLWATVAVLPFIDGFARPEPIAGTLLPVWLQSLDEAAVTGAMRRFENRQQDRSTYLVEVTMVPELVTTCVFEVRHVPNHEIDGFRTVAAPIDEVADFYEDTYRWRCDQLYEPVPLAEGCQHLLIALDESLHTGSQLDKSRPPWPLNMPVAALVIELAMSRLQATDDQPYLALRRRTGGAAPAAEALRRSLMAEAAI